MRTALFVALALACVALVACTEDKKPITPTPTEAPATESPSPTVMPLITAAPTPVGDQWTLFGEVTGTAYMTDVACATSGDSLQVTLTGTTQGETFVAAISFNSDATGTLTYGEPDTTLTIDVNYADATPDALHWADGGGATGTGKATISEGGSGTLDVVVPISADAPGKATRSLNLTGRWTCPSPSPT